MTNHVKQFGRLVAEQRKRHGLTQQQVAEEIGCHQTTLAKIEGGGFLAFNDAIELARLLDISIDTMAAKVPADAAIDRRVQIAKRTVAQQLRFIIGTLESA